MMRKSKFWILAVCLVFVFAHALGQVETARITGTATDSTGAVLPGVEVTFTHLQTNRQATALTNDEGRYVSVPLAIGEYVVEAQLPGFKRVTRSGILLEVQETAVVDLTLEVGEITETVEVMADSPLLATSEPTQGQVIDNQKIVDLPLNGRDYIQLALLSVGAIQPVGGRFGGFSAAGQRTTQNNYLLDGIDNNGVQIAAQGRRAEVVKPSIDAIQEFKVVTNSYSAEFGRAAGGVVNVTLRSGGNELHGTIFGFLRNEVLDAKNFFDDPDKPKPAFKRSQFGFAVGGPIAQDKTFIFGDYEGTRVRESRTVLNTIPTLKMQGGDFSELSDIIFDPLTACGRFGNPPCALDGKGKEIITRQPFPNNIIPDNRIDSIARQAAAWYPAPQNDRLTQNFLNTPPNQEDIDRYDIRVDHVFSSEDNIYYRFSYNRNFLPESPPLPPPAFGSTSNSTPFTHTGANTGLVWNHVFSPNFITSSRLGWNRIYTERQPPIDTNVNSELGLKGVNQTLAGAPVFNLSGYTNLGLGSFIPNLIDSQNRQVVNDTTWMRGNHNLKFGINIMLLQSYLSNPQQELGQFIFNGNFTRDPVSGKEGDPFADFLLGIPRRTDVSNSVFMNLRAPWYNFYVHDEWHATPELTLNFGLRYELRLPWIEKENGISNFDIDTDPDNPVFVVAKDGSRLDRATMSTDKNNFAPRFGIAYQLRPGTILRGGYGIFIANYEGTGGGQYLETNPPFHIKTQISTDSITPEVILGQGVPTGILTPENAVSLRFSSFERHPSLPYSQQWNLNIQHQLAQDLVWEIGYYGAKANHLVQRINRNFAPPGKGNINKRRRYTTAIFPGTNIAVGPLAAMNRHEFNGNSNFHSFQTRIEKRLSGGFSLLGSYMWSKTIGDSCGFAGSGNAGGCGVQNPLNLQAQRALDNQHLTHRFVMSYIWDLPFGEGRRWGSGLGSVANTFLGGWSVGSIINLNSGQPRSPTVRGNPSNTGDTDRPKLVGEPNLSGGERTVERWFNTDAFEKNDKFTFGNAGRNIIFEPGRSNIDFAAYKRFQVSEDVDVQFRFEAFNLFNTPPFGSPNTQVGNRNFGKITSAGRPRNLQFGLKIIF